MRYQMEDNQRDMLDHDEYIRLLMKNQAHIFTYIQILVSDYQDAEDIFQDVAAIAWKKLADYEPGSNFTAWLLSIARHRIMYYWQKKKNSIIHYSEAAVMAVEEHISSNFQKTSNDYHYLEECINKLSENDARLVRIRYSRKITIKRLAEELGRSIQGLYSTMSRIHITLAECIQRKRVAEER